MTNFDKTEQRIHDAFSQIDVDVETFKSKLDFSATAKTKKSIRIPTIAAAVLIFAIISACAYAAMVGLDFFRAEFNPPFIDFATAPLEPAYAEDQGIRMEIVGAERIGDIVLLYLTMQDVSGENRFSIDPWGFWPSPDLEIHMNSQEVSTGGNIPHGLYFNEDTQTIYYEMRLTVDFDMPITDTLEIVNTHIHIALRNGPAEYIVGEWQMEVSIANVNHPTISWMDVQAGDIHIEHMILSPFGIHLSGTHGLVDWFDTLDWLEDWVDLDSFEPGVENWPDLLDWLDSIESGTEDWDWEDWFEFSVEFSDWLDLGNLFELEIEIEFNSQSIKIGGGSSAIGPNTFDCWIPSNYPIDVEAVTAIIFNGYRVEVE